MLTPLVLAYKTDAKAVVEEDGRGDEVRQADQGRSTCTRDVNYFGQRVSRP